MRRKLQDILQRNISKGISSQFKKHEEMLNVKEDFIKSGKLLELKASDILEDTSFQIRSEHISAEEFENLKESLRVHKQQVPIFVRKKGEKFQVIGGFNRFKALKALKEPIMAICKDVKDEEAYIIAEIENLQRNDLSIVDIYNYIKKLEERGLTQKDIALRLNKSDRMIRNYLTIGENKRLFKLVKTNVITIFEAIKLSHMPAEKLNKKIVELGKINVSDSGSKTSKKKILGAGKDVIIDADKNIIKITIADTFKHKEKVIARLQDIISELKKA